MFDVKEGRVTIVRDDRPNPVFIDDVIRTEEGLEPIQKGATVNPLNPNGYM